MFLRTGWKMLKRTSPSGGCWKPMKSPEVKHFCVQRNQEWWH